jgi:DNA-binding NtrC family response regulator
VACDTSAAPRAGTALAADAAPGAARAAPHAGVAPGARLAATVTTGGPDAGPGAEIHTALATRFVHRIDIPPLAHRPDDIVEIAQTLMRRHAGGPVRRLTKAALQVLRRCEWPGNVRQLEGVVLAALDRRPSGDIATDDLPRHLAVRSGAAALTAMQSAERQAIVEALQSTDGNKQEAALLLGIARSTLYRKLRELQIAGS